MMKPLIRDYLEKDELFIHDIIKHLPPWEAVGNISSILKKLKTKLDLDQYIVNGDQIIHKEANIEATAQLKGPMIIGPRCFVANGSLLRGGVILDAGCVVGHCGEIKASIMMTESKVAHMNFVGDSILGANVNIEGGAIIANYRNEYGNKEIAIVHESTVLQTGVEKFGAILGDRTKVGANAVIAPGSMLAKDSIVQRGAVVDQCKEY